MDCPYCYSDIFDEAVVCKVCKRDVYLFKSLQSRIAELEAQISEIHTLPANAYDETSGRTVPLFNPQNDRESNLGLKLIFVDFFIYLCLPCLILVAAHGIITIVYDTKMIYLRIISIIVPFLFGYLLFVNRYRKLWPWLVGLLFLTAASILGMSSLTSLSDHSPIFPQSIFEWREFLEYSVSIFFSYFTGISLGMTIFASSNPARSKCASPFIKMALRLLGANKRSPAANQSLLTKIETYGGALATILSTIFAIYSGLKRFM